MILFGNLPAVMTLYAPMIVAWLLIALMETGLKPDDPALATALYGLGLLVVAAASLVATMTLQLTVLHHLETGGFPVGQAWREAVPRIAPFVLLAVIFIVLSLTTMALLFIPFLFVFPAIFLAPMIWLAERCTILDSFHRSVALTRGHRWPILGMIAVITLAAVAINLAAGAPKTLFDMAELVPRQIVGQVVSLVFNLVVTILIVVVYARLTGRAR